MGLIDEVTAWFHRNDPTTGKDEQLLKVSVGGISIPAYDTMTATYPTTTQEVYVFKSGATTVATVTVNYLAADKKEISTAVRT